MRSLTIIFLTVSTQIVAGQNFMTYYEKTYGKEEIQDYYSRLSSQSTDSLKKLLHDVPMRLTTWDFLEEHMNRPKVDKETVDYNKLLGFLSYFVLKEGEKSNEIDLFHLAWIKEENGDFQEAIADLTKCLKGPFNEQTFPSISLIYSVRGECKFEVGDLYGAIADLTESIKVDLRNTNDLLLRGRTYGRLKKYTEAINDFTKAVEINKEESKAYYYRGLTYAFMDQKEKACLDFSKAGELGLSEAYEKIKEICN